MALMITGLINMALMITGFLAIMIVVGGHSQPQELHPDNSTDKLLTAVSLFNGYFINMGNLSNGNLTFIPAEITAFPGYPAFYLEESDDKVVKRQSISVIKELDDGTIKLQNYKFTDPSQSTPNTFDISTLMDLDLEDFSPAPEMCLITFNPVFEDFMIGDFPGCGYRLENGDLPHFTMNITCGGFSIFDVDEESQERNIRFIYDNGHLCGSRYPYPQFMQERLANFESPCDD